VPPASRALTGDGERLPCDLLAYPDPNKTVRVDNLDLVTPEVPADEGVNCGQPLETMSWHARLGEPEHLRHLGGCGPARMPSPWA
jgi:hypothetical protein